jgi:hypothetical protein
MAKYYFSYGSNLNKAQMKRRCPKAVAVGPLEMPQAQLIFNGVADVVWHATKSAVGGLWRITDECEAALDGFEGVALKGGGAYRKETIRVLVTVGGVEQEDDALIYVMNRSIRRMPSTEYLATIREGFANFGLDKQFLRTALLDTKAAVAEREASRAAKNVVNDADRRRWAKEDADEARQRRNRYSGGSYYQPGPRRNLNDLFPDTCSETRDVVEWDDGELTYTEPPKPVKRDKVKPKGYIAPKRKSIHLFDEPSPRYNKAR